MAWGFYILHSMAPYLSIVLAVISIIKTFLIKQHATYIKRHHKQVNDAKASLRSFAVEILSNIKVVKSFSTEKEET